MSNPAEKPIPIYPYKQYCVDAAHDDGDEDVTLNFVANISLDGNYAGLVGVRIRVDIPDEVAIGMLRKLIQEIEARYLGEVAWATLLREAKANHGLAGTLPAEYPRYSS